MEPVTIRRLNPTNWLAKALDVLTNEGFAAVRIERLAKALGVTKGSFYWHFKDHRDLLDGILAYWAEELTENVVEMVNQAHGDAKQRLLTLMAILSDEKFGRHEAAIRAWSTHDRAAAAVVKKVDQQRLATIRKLFRQMGFRGDQVEMRTRLFAYYYVAESSIRDRESDQERLRLLKLRHKLLTSRTPS